MQHEWSRFGCSPKTVRGSIVLALSLAVAAALPEDTQGESPDRSRVRVWEREQGHATITAFTEPAGEHLARLISAANARFAIGLSMNLDMKSGAEAHALHTLRAILRGFEHREAPPPRESAAVYRRFRFMATGQFKKEQAAFHEP